MVTAFFVTRLLHGYFQIYLNVNKSLEREKELAGMNARYLQTLKLENDLRRALKDNQLQLYYQPSLDMKPQEIVGMEALIRWHHPEMGMIPPAEFTFEQQLLEKSQISASLKDAQAM